MRYSEGRRPFHLTHWNHLPNRNIYMNLKGTRLIRLFQRYRKTLDCRLLLLAGGVQPLTERALRTDLALKSISLTATELLLVVAQSPCRRRSYLFPVIIYYHNLSQKSTGKSVQIWENWGQKVCADCLLTFLLACDIMEIPRARPVGARPNFYLAFKK